MVLVFSIFYPFLFDFLNNLSFDNKLISAVYHDFQVLHFRVACQALGLIDKYVTGPLWRMMVKEKEVLNMSKHYQKMYKFFNDCLLDATPFLEVRNSLFPELFAFWNNAMLSPVTLQLHHKNLLSWFNKFVMYKLLVLFT